MFVVPPVKLSVPAPLTSEPAFRFCVPPLNCSVEDAGTANEPVLVPTEQFVGPFTVRSPEPAIVPPVKLSEGALEAAFRFRLPPLTLSGLLPRAGALMFIVPAVKLRFPAPEIDEPAFRFVVLPLK